MKYPLNKLLRRAIVSAIFLLAGNCLFAQSPFGFSYQAVLRNAGNELMQNRQVTIKVTILQVTDQESVVYEEMHYAATNVNGLVSLVIGSGIVLSGNLEQVDWTNGRFFLKTETDPTGGNNFSITGITQLLSVPFALHAKTADALTNPQSESDPLFSGSPASNIGMQDLDNWNKAFNWGDHQQEGYIKMESQSLADVLKIGNDGDQMVIRNLADPVDLQDAATKNYVDSLRMIFYELAYYTGTLENKVIHMDKRLSDIEKILLSAGLYKVFDGDGNEYNVIRIGDMFWTAENLRTTKYINGMDIPLVTDANAWSNLDYEAYCWYNNDFINNPATYGALYNWYAVDRGRLCPDGWHVATADDWNLLVQYAGGYLVAGGNLKETGFDHWDIPNFGATDLYGFKALPGGQRDKYGNFGEMGRFGYWWSPQYQIVTDMDTYYSIGFNSSEVLSIQEDLRTGYSVRCVRD